MTTRPDPLLALPQKFVVMLYRLSIYFVTVIFASIIRKAPRYFISSLFLKFILPILMCCVVIFYCYGELKDTVAPKRTNYAPITAEIHLYCERDYVSSGEFSLIGSTHYIYRLHIKFKDKGEGCSRLILGCSSTCETVTFTKDGGHLLLLENVVAKKWEHHRTPPDNYSSTEFDAEEVDWYAHAYMNGEIINDQEFVDIENKLLPKDFLLNDITDVEMTFDVEDPFSMRKSFSRSDLILEVTTAASDVLVDRDKKLSLTAPPAYQVVSFAPSDALVEPSDFGIKLTAKSKHSSTRMIVTLDDIEKSEIK